MRIEELIEEKGVKTVKAKRMMKFSLRNGENDLGLDLNGFDFKCTYSKSWGVAYLGKSVLPLDEYVILENSEKPGFDATRNIKLGSGVKFTGTLSSFADLVKASKDHRSFVIVVDPSILGATPAKKKKPDAPTNTEDGWFLLGSWSNPYRGGDDEYFWSGPFYYRKNAMATGKRKQKNGQPRNFRDWVEGTTKAIQGLDKLVAAAKKAGLNPNVSELHWVDTFDGEDGDEYDPD